MVGIQLKNYFNHALFNNLNQFLKKNNNLYKVLWVCGDLGCGKSFAIHSQLKNNKIPYHIIVFSDENIFPFNEIVSDSNYCTEEAFLIKASELLLSGNVIVFENIEKAKKDHINIILRLLKYHKNANNNIMVIFEQNTCKNDFSYKDSVITLTQHVPATGEKDFMSYMYDHFIKNTSNYPLFEKIISIANSNIQNFFVCLNILKHEGIIAQKHDKLFFKKPNELKSDNLLSLYGQLFDSLDMQMQEPFRVSAPFSPNMYDKILRVIIRNYSNFENYLYKISDYKSIIKTNEENNSNSIFQSTYSFVTEDARNAICNKISRNEQLDLIKKYYDYLDKIYHNRSKFNLISEQDKFLLLINLTKDRGGMLTVNQIPLIIDIMMYYYEHKLYFSVIEQGKRLLNSHILNEEQLNLTYHNFYLIYFRALLSTGNYNRIIAYKDRFNDEDINFIIATALYNFGQPNHALEVLNSIKTNIHAINHGYINNLISSIYDWLGNNKESSRHFKIALRTSVQDDELKYQLYKKYSMYIDFQLPECQDKLKQAIKFYAEKDLKQYAECLHNYGTGFIMQFEFDSGRKYLNESINVLDKICSEEVYYSLNSLAISYCYKSKDFKQAIHVWNDALKLNIGIDFCELAIQNNLFLAYIHSHDYAKADKQQAAIETALIKICKGEKNIDGLKEIRPDIQHQLRQFHFNCAIYYKMKNLTYESLQEFYKAKQCSCYDSVMLYSINKNILELEKSLKINKLHIKKIPHPTKLEKHIYECDMYFCEIMFWG